MTAFFLREKHGQLAECKLCNTRLKTVGGSTKGHLKRLHVINVLKRQAAQAEGDGDNSPKLTTAKRARLATGVGPMSKYLCHKNEHAYAPSCDSTNDSSRWIAVQGLCHFTRPTQS